MNDQHYILTIATGKKLYLDMAINLARSFVWWHPDGAIIFQLVTDQNDEIPADIVNKIQVIKVNPGELGVGFSSKLQLDKLVSFGKTLFIDSDCLIFGNLSYLFEAFNGHSVSVVGNYIADGEWFGNIADICTKFGVQRIPKFNGGIYYLEKNAESIKVYEAARDLEKQYDEIGFKRLRNRPNDEVLMALSMQLNNQSPIIDDGTILSDPQACPGEYKIDVISGERYLINPPAPSPLHQNWYPFQKVSPIIVHFLGDFTSHYPYRRECYRLKKALSKELNLFSEVFAVLYIEYPSRIKERLKNTFRPAYHKLVGFRKVRKSNRI